MKLRQYNIRPLIAAAAVALLGSAAAGGSHAAGLGGMGAPSGGLSAISCDNPGFDGQCIDRSLALDLAGDDLLIAWSTCDRDERAIADCIQVVVADSLLSNNHSQYRLTNATCSGDVGSGCYHGREYTLRVDATSQQVSDPGAAAHAVTINTSYHVPTNAPSLGLVAQHRGDAEMVIESSPSGINWTIDLYDADGTLEDSEAGGWIAADSGSSAYERCLRMSRFQNAALESAGQATSGLFRMATSLGRVLSLGDTLTVGGAGITLTKASPGRISKAETDEIVAGAGNVWGAVMNFRSAGMEHVCGVYFGFPTVPEGLTPLARPKPIGADAERIACVGPTAIECVEAAGVFQNNGNDEDEDESDAPQGGDDDEIDDDAYYEITVYGEEDACEEGETLALTCSSYAYVRGATASGE